MLVPGTLQTGGYLDTAGLDTAGLDAAGPGTLDLDTAAPDRDSLLEHVGFLRPVSELPSARQSRFAHLRSGCGRGGGGAT